MANNEIVVEIGAPIQRFRDELKSASRSCLLVINNKSTIPWYRVAHTLGGGKWRRFPVECIMPGAAAIVSAESSGLLTGTSGSVTYKAHDSDVPFTFEFNVPYLGHKCAHILPEFRYDHYSIEKSFLMENAMELILTMHGVSKTAMSPAVAQPHGVPSAPSIQSEDWKSELNKAQRSMLVRLQNNTPYYLERIQFELMHGIWRKEPPIHIYPETTAEFGSESQGLTGTEGFVTYRLIIHSVNNNTTTATQNAIRCYYSVPPIGGAKKLQEDKIDGFSSIYLDIHRQNVDNSNVVTWTLFEKLTEPGRLPGYEQVPPQGQQLPYVPAQPNFAPASTPQARPQQSDVLAVLNQQAEQELPPVDNKMGLNIYYHMAAQWYDQGMIAKRSGNIELAYMQFLKYTTFVLEKLPRHLSYNLLRFEDDKSQARSKCVRIMKDLEEMQHQITERSKTLATIPGVQFPSVPADVDTTTVPQLPDVPNNTQIDPSSKPAFRM